MSDEYSLQHLRDRLVTLNVWPPGGDDFLTLLPYSRFEAPPPSEEDYKWLTRVVEGVHKGEDIGAVYPSFFQKLLMSNELRQQFIIALDK